ncbi:serine/threonine-protein kinase [Mycobacterium decipiens]|uniref:non-specific serine/threonine protein kinase n=1 Tax=Mycobacterium decipiens TaxID=1430326 RepID=A0A1X2LYQ6_9MYCO|nr:serine/threonine-protein kinase [Mycobacterium decipiens]OSC42363.1 serine/threonine protein kinase [Mycobacterium decipiens]
MALASGATFAGYTVVRMLGSSGTGEVYLVQQPGFPGWQALKVLSPAIAADGEFRRRFQQETEVAARLYHPHILEVHDRGEFDGQLWIAMDYVHGIDAIQLMADRFPAVLPVGEVLAIVTAVAAALDYGHQRGLLHRDVSPANIVLTTAGAGQQRILLADFGIASQPGSSHGAIATYPAPELLAGDHIDGRADQYALAVTAMHLLAGAPPVDHPHTGLAQPPKLSVLRPDLVRLDGVFSRALAAEPGERFGSCREFAEAVNEQAGVPVGEHSPEVIEAAGITAAAGGEAYVVDYPAYGWPEDIAGAQPSVPKPAPAAPTSQRRGSLLQSAAGVLARRLDDFSSATRDPGAPRRRRPRRILVGAAAVLLLVGLFAVGIAVGRKTHPTSTEVAGPPTSASAAPSAPPASAPVTAPAPLDGTYRIEIERSKQTYDYTPTPQPPDVNTWWAFRTSCTPAECLAAATMLDDTDHTTAKSPPVKPFLMQFGDGQWKSRAETVQFPCVGPNGSASTQTTTQVLSLRPQPEGDLRGEMVVTVQSNECGQQGAVIRIPAVASRSGDLPSAVTVPDPATIPDVPAATSTAPSPPTTTASGPGR